VEAVMVLVALVTLAVLALRFGEDSRDGFPLVRLTHADRRVPTWWAEAGGDRRASEVPATW
jgi:hypothetical protein